MPLPARRSRTARGLIVAWVSFLAAWAVGQIARDATWLTGLGFYIPSVVVATVLVILAAGYLATKRHRLALAAVAASIPPLVFVGFVENGFSPRPELPEGEFRLVHWNTGGRPARPGVGEYLVGERADLYVLSEVPAAHVGAFRDRLGPGYQSVTFGNLAAVGRGGFGRTAG
ncbi:MAG TPA: hypothetical protein VH092_09465 [Urbifossiella sp.]|jgi:hypothetical protein|nr:hypothetical protein [Urbifossiella sp.]